MRPSSVLRAAALLGAAVLSACSFDYGRGEDAGPERPDLVMTDLEFVRVRDGEPLVRVQADVAERYDRSRRMRMEGVRFVQYAPKGGGEGAVGSAGEAEVQTVSGDAALSGGVVVRVKSSGDDLAIETARLEWKDADRRASAPADEAVLIKRADGAVLTGRGFSSDGRSHSWEFSGGVSGTYIDEGDDAEAAASEEAVP